MRRATNYFVTRVRSSREGMMARPRINMCRATIKHFYCTRVFTTLFLRSNREKSSFEFFFFGFCSRALLIRHWHDSDSLRAAHSNFTFFFRIFSILFLVRSAVCHGSDIAILVEQHFSPETGTNFTHKRWLFVMGDAVVWARRQHDAEHVC